MNLINLIKILTVKQQSVRFTLLVRVQLLATKLGTNQLSILLTYLSFSLLTTCPRMRYLGTGQS